MPITFSPLPPLVEIRTDGAVVVDGEALVAALAPGQLAVSGVVAVTGDASLEVSYGPPDPVIPTAADGTVFVSGESVLGGATPATADGSVAPYGEALCGSTVDGYVGIAGEARADADYPTATVFMVEPQAIIVSYAGQAFASVRDTLNLGDGASRVYTAVSRTALALRGHREAVYEGEVSTSDSLAMDARASWIIRLLVTSRLTLNSLATADYLVLARAVSKLLLTGHATCYAEAIQQITDSLVFHEVSVASQIGYAKDGLTLAERVDSAYTAIAAAIERLALGAAASHTYSLTVILRDTFVLNGAASHQAELALQLRDAIGFAASLSFDDGQMIAWTLNTESRGVTRYTNYPFNSFAKIGGHYYGAHSGGLAKIGGPDDMGEPIKARIRLGMSDFGDRRIKSFSEVFIGVATNGQLLLKTIYVDETTGEKNMAIYKVAARPAAAARETRAKVGRGMKAVDWDFELENVDGADFDLQSIEFNPTTTTRRTRG